MPSPRRSAAFALAMALTAASAPRPPVAHAQAAAASDVPAQVRRLLSDRCFTCHGPDAGKRKAKLRLDTREGLFKDLDAGMAIVVPRDTSRSELIRRIQLPDDDEDVMPPADAHRELSTADKALLVQWVRDGAAYRGHWSWEPVASPPAPTATGASVANPIDAFVRARLRAEGLTPAHRAAPDVLLRRVSFTLTGLPPTPAERDALMADPSADGYAKAVDRLLASPAYGERMATDWLDLARYADTYGYQADVTRDMSPYRDWVIDAFNRNLPYDRFLTWQLAGDLLPNATREQRVATAFNRLHRQTNEGGSIEEEFRAEYVADRVNTFGTAMLGLTLECARCHDHKFDAITQRDYYSLAAFFNSIDESGLYSHFTNATPTPSLLLWPAHEEARHAAVVERIAAIEARLRTRARDGEAAFRAWRPGAAVAPPTPILSLPFDSADEAAPDAPADEDVALEDAPAVVADDEASGGRAFRFSGDNAVTPRGVRTFARADAFSIAVRVKPMERRSRAVVLHQSRAWSDAGSRGFELTLDDGRPFFGLIHFWPGNAIAIRARDPLPLHAWSSVVVTYDGSSRASGLAIHVDGRRSAVDVVRDRLSKDIGYDKADGDLQTTRVPLTVGARFRDSGLRNGLLDDLRVFDVALTDAEVAGTLDGADDEVARAYYFARVDRPSMRERDVLRRARGEESRLIAHVPELMVMEELPEPRPAYRLERGAYDAPRERVARDTPASLPPFPADAPRNRLGLARWLTSPGNPLAARVVVNRLWKMHFGRGLVASVEDFGSQGRLPSHPDLLDWLAARLIASGWDVKALHRLIVTSDTFAQDSRVTADQVQRDPDNVWLARGPVMRLPAEHIRDAALAASDLLVRQVGGPSVKPYQPEGLWEQSGTGKTYAQDSGDKVHRRSLYTFWRRTSPPPAMTTFDAVSREVCVARRDVTMTPLQSLVLLNDPQFVEAARVLAERLVRQFRDDPDARHREAVRRLIGREPDARERVILRQAYDEQHAFYEAHRAEAERLRLVGERPADPTLPAVAVAATAGVASLIMNFDAFVVTR